MVEVKIITPHWKDVYSGFSPFPKTIEPYFEKATYILQLKTPTPKSA